MATRVLVAIAWTGWLVVATVQASTERYLTDGGVWTLLTFLSGLVTLVAVIAMLTRAIPRWLRRLPARRRTVERRHQLLAKRLLRRWDEQFQRRGWDHRQPVIARWLMTTADGQTMGLSTDLAPVLAYDAPHRLITGPAGSGKSYLAAAMTRELLRRRAAADPVPVLVSVAGWDARTVPLRQWLITQLTVLPGARIGYPLARSLVLEGRILPVLDGVDELAPQVGAAAASALELAGPWIVVTRDSDPYLNDLKVQCGATIEPLPLRASDIAARLEPLLGTAPAPDSLIVMACGLPVVLDLLLRHPDPQALQGLETTADIRRPLLARLIPEMFAAYANHRWDPRKAERWLGFLAHHMVLRGGGELRWWQLRDAIHSNAWQSGKLVNTPGGNKYPGQLDLSLTGRWRSLLGALRWSFVLVGFVALTAAIPEAISVVAPELAGENVAGAVDVANIFAGVFGCIGLAAGLILGLHRWSQRDQETPVTLPPRESLRRDRRMSRFQRRLYGLVLGIVGGLGVGLAMAIDDEDPMLVVAGLLAVGPVGFIIGYLFGLLGFSFGSTASGIYVAAVRYLALRGRVPWRLMPFLEDACRAGILRRQGGVYQFRHDWLLNRLAQSYRDVDQAAG